MPYITLTFAGNKKHDVVVNIDHIVAFHQSASSPDTVLVTTAINGSQSARLLTVVEDMTTVMTLIEDAELKNSRR